MKRYIDTALGFWDFEEDGSQDYLITEDMVLAPLDENDEPYKYCKFDVDSNIVPDVDRINADNESNIISDKWNDLDIYLSDLTVTISNDRIVDVSPSSLLSIDNEINAMTDQDISTWHEAWGSFEVNKVDLQEARTKRKKAKDDKILELGIGA